jgi:hypothetical protein
MNVTLHSLKRVGFIAAIVVALVGCGEKETGTVASDGSVPSDPHASLSVAADVMKAPADAEGGEAAAEAQK